MSEEANVNELKEYEISYVLATEDAASEIEKEFAALGCQVVQKGPLAAVKLAYPVKKHASGFFGYTRFSAMPEDIKKLHDALALKPGVLRFLIVTPPVKQMAREARQPRERDAQQKPASSVAAKETSSTAVSAQPATSHASEALSNELLEKKLEEILK